MNMPRRLLWRVARLVGGRARQWAWDDQFKRGYWAQLPTRSPAAVALIVDLAGNGKIVDCGCGEGYLLDALLDSGFDPSRYEGFDVSDVAVASAQERHPAARFYVADMARWPGTTDASLIVAEEAIYYLSQAELRRFIEKAQQSLADDGAILCIIHDADKHAETVAILERLMPAVRHMLGRRLSLIMKPEQV